jgi:hypothetical protein
VTGRHLVTAPRSLSLALGVSSGLYMSAALGAVEHGPSPTARPPKTLASEKPPAEHECHGGGGDAAYEAREVREAREGREPQDGPDRSDRT